MNLSLKRDLLLEERKIKFNEKNVHNLNITVRCILLFCDKMPDNKPEDSTELLSCKNSLEIMANDAINKLLSASMEKDLIKNEKELTVTFVRGKKFGKYLFGDTLLLPDGYRKQKIINTLI